MAETTRRDEQGYGGAFPVACTAALRPTLADFLLARIAEDEAEARKAQSRAEADDLWVVTGMDSPVGVDYDPDRVLAECEAKRRIVAEHEVQVTMRGQVEGLPHLSCQTCDDCPPMEDPSPGACQTLRLLGLPYDSHPTYDEEWRP